MTMIMLLDRRAWRLTYPIVLLETGVDLVLRGKGAPRYIGPSLSSIASTSSLRDSRRINISIGWIINRLSLPAADDHPCSCP
jgi:hypothetical protein